MVKFIRKSIVEVFWYNMAVNWNLNIDIKFTMKLFQFKIIFPILLYFIISQGKIIIESIGSRFGRQVLSDHGWEPVDTWSSRPVAVRLTELVLPAKDSSLIPRKLCCSWILAGSPCFLSSAFSRPVTRQSYS